MHEKVLKEKLVKEFIQKNSRAPYKRELDVLLQKEKREKDKLKEIGFLGYEKEKVGFRQESSVERENSNREAIYYDLKTSNKAIIDFSENIEAQNKVSVSGLLSLLNELNKKEKAIDGLLLTEGDSIFVKEIVEDFGTENKLILSQSNLSLEENFCVLGKRNEVQVSTEKLKVKVGHLSTGNVLSFYQSKPPKEIFKASSEQWNYVVYSDKQNDTVGLIVEIELEEIVNITNVKINSFGNSGLRVGLFTSLNGTDYEIQNSISSLEKTNYMNLNREVKHLRLHFSKGHADTKSGNQWVYIFALENISLFKSTYRNLESKGIFGPYTFTNEQGDIEDFSLLSFNSCVEEPEMTYVTFGISVDGINWTPVGKETKLVNFGTVDPIFTQLETGNENGLVSGYVEDFSNSVVLNKALLVSFEKQIVLETLSGKRQIGEWNYLSEEKVYSAFVVTDVERTIDVGSASFELNGRKVSGKVKIPKGTSNVRISEYYYSEIVPGLNSEDKLKEEDLLYPYNLRYLFEGYRYSSTYVGEKIYSGFEEFYGSQMIYCLPEQYESTEDFKYFTILSDDNYVYFVVKVDKSSSGWESEKAEVSFKIKTASNNQFFVKAILRSNVLGLSPVIKWFRVRGI